MNFLQRGIWKIGKICLLTLVLFLLFRISCFANTQDNKSLAYVLKDKISISGIIESRFGNQFDYDEFEDKRYAYPIVRTTIKYDLSPKHQGYLFSKKKSYLKLSFEWNLLYKENKDDIRDENFGLYEGYLVLNKGPFRIRLGKQIIRWGKTDEISPVDNVNSQDLRLFIIPPYEDRKIPNWLLDVEFFKKNVRIEGVFIPFVEPNEVYYFDSNFAVFKQLKSSSLYYLNNYPLTPMQRDYLKNAINNLEVDKEIPSKSINNIQGGARIGVTFNRFDLALSYLNNFDLNPHIKFFPVSGIKIKEDFSGANIISRLPFLNIEKRDIQATFIRRNIFGAEFEGGFKDFGIRGEAAYFDKTSYLTETLTSIHRESLWYVVGVDYNGENDLYINAQFSHNHIFDYKDEILYFKEDNVSLLGELSKGFFAGNWKVGIKSSYFISDYSYFINPYIECKRIPNFHIEIGTIFFGGDRDTLLGQYDLLDQFYIKLKYYF